MDDERGAAEDNAEDDAEPAAYLERPGLGALHVLERELAEVVLLGEIIEYLLLLVASPEKGDNAE